MEEKGLSPDAFGLIYNRYAKDDPARVASFQEEADYEADFLAMASRIATALHRKGRG